MPVTLDRSQLNIDYPCRWEYRLIGLSEGGIRRAVSETVSGGDHTLRKSNRSSGGKYCSMVLELTVTSEEHRLELFGRLKDHREIVYLL